MNIRFRKSKKQYFNNSNNFDEFTISKKKHLQRFSTYNYDIELFGNRFDKHTWPLKPYQDLLVFAFIKQFVPPGSRILDVGGGNSRIIDFFKDNYECWNLDKLEGLGLGPKEIDETGFVLVKDYIGNFNREIPDNYFDFVFSISALEHVHHPDEKTCENILTDINRVTKAGGYNLHCLDAVIKPDRLWSNPVMSYLFEKENTLNQPITFDDLSGATDLFVLPEYIYNERWLPLTKQDYREYGRPLSYNIFWKKNK